MKGRQNRGSVREGDKSKSLKEMRVGWGKYRNIETNGDSKKWQSKEQHMKLHMKSITQKEFQLVYTNHNKTTCSSSLKSYYALDVNIHGKRHLYLLTLPPTFFSSFASLHYQPNKAGNWPSGPWTSAPHQLTNQGLAELRMGTPTELHQWLAIIADDGHKIQ